MAALHLGTSSSRTGSEMMIPQLLASGADGIGSLNPKPRDTGARSYLSGKTLLYVGGRTNQVPMLRRLAEERGADLLHHDGGLAESAQSLAILASRADAVLFPVDCISHSAAKMVKRICKQLDKSYFPLRRSGLASFVQFIQRHG
jgi:hypothetical protein